MGDIYSEQKRSEIMRNIKSRNTKPELVVKKLLCDLGYRQYRLSAAELICKPDIVFVKNKKAFFINGCFWHGHSCKKAHPPKKNHEFWQLKIENNKERDKRNYIELKNKRWDYIVIWECELKKKDRDILVKKIVEFMS